MPQLVITGFIPVTHFSTKSAVGSTGQRNMIYFMRHTEAHNGKDRTTRFIAAK
jgi:hypothetical protein